MPKQTFYNSINKIKSMLEAGIDIEALPEGMKLIEANAPKSQSEIDLETQVVEMEERIKGQDKSINNLKDNIRREKKRVPAFSMLLKS